MGGELEAKYGDLLLVKTQVASPRTNLTLFTIMNLVACDPFSEFLWRP